MSTKKKRKDFPSEFYCTSCGNRGIPIIRKPSHQKEAGHLKRLFCLCCNKESNHVEIRPFGSYTKDDFEKEFKLGRFIDGRRIPVTELMRCNKNQCDYNCEGKCWNSNYSYQCTYRKN